MAGYITKTQVIAQTAGGQDFEDVMDERKAELEKIEDKGLKFDTDTPTEQTDSAQSVEPPPDDDDDETESERQMRLVK